MNILREKTTATLLMLLLLLASLIVSVIPVLAQVIPWQPDSARFVGGGLINTSPDPWNEPDESIINHRCHIAVSGGRRDGTWWGRVVWRDLDHPGGVLVVLVEINSGTLLHDPVPGHHTEIFWLMGEAKVLVQGRDMGTFTAIVELADGAYMNPPAEPGSKPDWVGLHVMDATGATYYYTWHPRLAKGDIRCSWEPEYST
jgi:hypothetical protein